MKNNKKLSPQESLVLNLFKQHSNRELTSFQVHENIDEFNNVPITSVRRAITNLTKQGLLYKTHRLAMGDYGIRCNCWKINSEAL